MILKGSDILFYSGNSAAEQTLLALSSSCDVQVSCDMVEVSSMFSVRAKSFRAARYAWGINAEAYAADDSQHLAPLTVLKAGTPIYVTMTVTDPSGNAIGVAGEAYVASWALNGAVGALASYTISLQGSGELEVMV